MTDLEQQQLEARLSEAFTQLHGYAASIGDSRERYKTTGDPRYINAINNVIPLYNEALKRYNDIARQLGQSESPADFLVTLSEASDWLNNAAVTAGGIVVAGADKANTTIKYLAVAAVVLGVAYIFGPGTLGTLLKRRR